jgi:hypothetical protein
MPTATRQDEVTEDPLTGSRKRAEYNPAERAFSMHLRQRLENLLEGKANYLPVLRKYPAEPNRLGVLISPVGLARAQLRLDVVERLAWDTIMVMRAGETPGGPVWQTVDVDGSIVETQTFTTRFPHIVVERTDRFTDGRDQPTEITWYLRRVQNQRAQTQVNRLLDAANLAFELVRLVV